jgi:huntingtin
MASGQNPSTHAIPALQPIVNDLFIVRKASKDEETRELDTQRSIKGLGG